MNQKTDLPRVTVEMYNGRPTLKWDGEPYFYTSYFIRHVVDRDENNSLIPMVDRERYVHELADLCRPFAQRGIHGFEIPVNIGWNGPNDWDWQHIKNTRNGEPAEDQFKAIIAADPDARAMVNFLIHAPAAWKEAYPDEFDLDATGKRHDISLGSDLYLNELTEQLPKFIEYIENGPYAKHVLTYFFSYGNEGFNSSCLENSVGDFSPAMHRYFRKWLREHYHGDEAALRAAWKNDDVTFETAGVPTLDEQRYTDLGWFRDPTGGRKVFDYIQSRVDRYVEIHYRVAHAVKEACNYRIPVYCFGAYLQVTGWPGTYWFTKGMVDQEYNPHALSVQSGWRRIIECPDIDGWESPYDYFYRQMGGVCLNQSIEESMKLRGKIYQVNEDTRTYLAWEAGDVYGTVETKEETTAVYRRNFGAIASHWGGCNWMEQIRNWLQADDILDQLGEFSRLLQCSLDWPETPVDPIGVILDEESIPYEKPLIDLDWDLVYKQRIFGLAHCGVPFRFHLLDDLALDNMPDYKCYMFLNQFYLNEEKEALIREKVFRDGKTALWMIAPGFCHQTEGLSLESMKRLTGFTFKKFDAAWEQWVTLSNYSHPITKGLAHDLTYGSNSRIGPAFYVSDPEATVLGKRLLFQGQHEPALAIKELGTHRSMYSAVPLLPADLLRNIARYAGCHVYTEENDVVMAGRGLITYHTVADGERTVKLPAPSSVYDLFTGDQLAANASQVQLTFDQPGTKVLTTLPPELWRK
ncbi:MAG: hypothetical protein ACYDBB_14510 [Armatimonadota bacterium]